MLSEAFRRRSLPHLRSLFCSQLFSTAASTGPTANSDPARSGPPPIRVAQTSSAGRGVFATRPIAAGETIHSAKPLVTHPSLSRLHEAFYEVESRGDWSMFNEYCRDHGLKYPLMVKRLACMVMCGAVSSDCLDILQPAHLHKEMLPEIEQEFKLLVNAFEKAKIASEVMTFLSKEWYISVLARIRINAFRIELACGSYEDLLASAVELVGGDPAVGNAVYIVPSFYNHDCDPNTHIVWLDTSEAKMKALRNIEEGEELRICYIDASMGKEARQKVLSEGFGFNCNCPRCLSGE